MSDNTFRFYLKKSPSIYYAVLNGQVIETPTKTEIKAGVSDWEDVTVAVKRNVSNMGGFREYTTPTSFVLDMAKILKTIYYEGGINAECIFEIEKLDTYTMSYLLWYSGDVDLSKIDIKENYVVANVLERSAMALFKNRLNTPYEISLDDPDAKTMTCTPVLLDNVAVWQLGYSTAQYTGTTDWRLNIETDVLNTLFVTRRDQKQFAPFLDMHDQYKYIGGTITALYSQEDTWAGRTKKLKLSNIRFRGLCRAGIELNDPGLHELQLVMQVGWPEDNTSGHIDDTVILGSAPVSGLGEQYINIPISASLPSIEEYRVIFLFYRIIAPSGVNAVKKLTFLLDDSLLEMHYFGAIQSTLCKGFRYFDFAKKLVSKISDDEYNLVSTFLTNLYGSEEEARNANFDNIPYHTMVTCGDGIRSISDAIIKTTFSDMMKDCWSRWGLVWSVEDNSIRIEPLEYYFQNTELFTINGINNVKINPFLEVVFNQIQIGYQSYDNNLPAGKNEFNTGLSFLAEDMIRHKNQDDCISPYRADIYGIESIRAKTLYEDTKDNSFDNDIFLIEVSPNPSPISGVYMPLKGYQYITGVDDPTGMYNVTLSPKRSLYRHLRRIRSIQDAGILRYQTTDRNPDLVSNVSVGVITERNDVDLSSSSISFPNGITVQFPPLFQPTIIEFDCAPPYNLIEMINMKKAGYISFESRGNTFKGFIMDVGVKPATRDKYTFRLLSHPDNKLHLLL